jgi:hypothetical protein
MLIGVGMLVLFVVVVGAVVAFTMAGRQAMDEAGPPSEPSDFVAPVSSGGYRWRGVDETAEQFKERIARENAGGKPKPG